MSGFMTAFAINMLVSSVQAPLESGHKNCAPKRESYFRQNDWWQNDNCKEAGGVHILQLWILQI